MKNIHVNILWGLMVLLLLAGHGVAGDEDFTIAVASESPEATGQISTVAARAAYFLFFDKDGDLLEAAVNPYADVAGGAGPRAARFLIDKHIQVVIAGHFGSKMSNALKAENIQYIEGQGTIRDEVEKVIHAK